MLGLFARKETSAERPRAELRPRADLEAPSSPMLNDASNLRSSGARDVQETNLVQAKAPTLASDIASKTSSDLQMHRRLDDICSQIALLTQKVEQQPVAHVRVDTDIQGHSSAQTNISDVDNHNAQLCMWLDARLTEMKAELLNKGQDRNNANSNMGDLHEAFRSLSGKVEDVSDKMGGVFEVHGQTLRILGDKMEKLDSQLGALTEGFYFLQRGMKNQLFLGSNDNFNVCEDNLIKSMSLQSEQDVAAKSSLEKTRNVQFVDLGATQLQMQNTADDFNRAPSTFSYKQRLQKWIHSMPEHGPLHRWHNTLTLLSTLLVAMNAIFIGVSVDQTLQALLNDEKPPVWIHQVEVVFSIALAVDLTVRILTWGKAFFVDKSERWWNLFDFLLCCAAISEPLFPDGTSRNFPALRIFRALRVFRVVRQFGTLRLMLAMITHAMTNVMWAFVFILMITYMAAVMFMQVIANKIDEFRDDHPSAWMEHVKSGMPEEWLDKIQLSYGNIVSACVTLIASISGGIDWIDASWCLLQVKPMYLIAYMLFVMFCVFGLMNVLTGIFVANTKEVSRIDRDLVIRSQLNDRKSFANQLKNILKSADKDGTGTISKQELMDHLVSDETAAYLRTLDVTASDAQGVFKLLDVTSTGEVSIDEFVLSLMRFQGSARSVDVATLLYEGKRSEARWNAYMDYIEEQFDVLRSRLHIDSRSIGSVQTHVSKANIVKAFSIPKGPVEAS